MKIRISVLWRSTNNVPPEKFSIWASCSIFSKWGSLENRSKIFKGIWLFSAGGISRRNFSAVRSSFSNLMIRGFLNWRLAATSKRRATAQIWLFWISGYFLTKKWGISPYFWVFDLIWPVNFFTWGDLFCNSKNRKSYKICHLKVLNLIPQYIVGKAYFLFQRYKITKSLKFMNFKFWSMICKNFRLPLFIIYGNKNGFKNFMLNISCQY